MPFKLRNIKAEHCISAGYSAKAGAWTMRKNKNKPFLNNTRQMSDRDTREKKIITWAKQKYWFSSPVVTLLNNSVQENKLLEANVGGLLNIYNTVSTSHRCASITKTREMIKVSPWGHCKFLPDGFLQGKLSNGWVQTTYCLVSEHCPAPQSGFYTPNTRKIKQKPNVTINQGHRPHWRHLPM